MQKISCKTILTKRTISFLLTLTMLSCSLSQKIATLKPEPDDAKPMKYESAISYVNFPVTIKLKDIENQANALLNGLIYEDNNIEDDNIEIRIWKVGALTLENNAENLNESIKTVLPLKATINYRIGTKILGMALYKTKELNLNGTVTLFSKTALINWKLNTKTILKSIDWNESPTTTIVGKNIPVTYLVNSAINRFKSKIEESIDRSIDKSLDFKPHFLNVLEKISTSFLINELHESWLQINPQEVYSTTAQLKNDSFIINMGIKTSIETYIGNQPKSKFDPSKIILKPVSKIQDIISANITAVSTYQDASRIITKNFIGQEFISNGKKIKVQKVSLWHKNGKIVIALDVLGNLNGTIYLTGFPNYNTKTKELYFDQLDYALDTKNKLIRTANWLVKGLILANIKEKCRYSIISNIEEGKKSIMKYLQDYSPMQGVFVNGKINNIEFQKIQLTNKAVIAFVQINGKLNVSINGLK